MGCGVKELQADSGVNPMPLTITCGNAVCPVAWHKTGRHGVVWQIRGCFCLFTARFSEQISTEIKKKTPVMAVDGSLFLWDVPDSTFATGA